MEDNILLALFALLAASAALVPLAKATGLGTVLGYLAAGILIGPYGLKLLTDSETIRHIAEFGIVLMLFLIGLDLQPREVWRMRNKVLGLGLPQMLLTALAVTLSLQLFGFALNTAIIVGLAFAMSSTAIAMQTAEQRDITRTDAGRASLAVLLVQDVAVIPILALVPLLALASGSSIEVELTEAVAEVESPVFWQTSLLIVVTFVAAIVGGRYVVRPLLAFVARTAVREAFTALALALVIGAALATQALGLSPALGAFIGGVLLADSEYRHELESNLQPFKGLLLGLFFVSVGMSIAFSEFLDSPWMIAALVLSVIVIKFAVLFLLCTLFRMNLADRLLVATLLSQAGEFAFVVLQFANTNGALDPEAFAMFTVVVALSMATTPLLLLGFDRLIAPRLDARSESEGRDPDTVEEHRKIVVLGYGRFGQIITRMLRSHGYDMTLIDDDAAQIELVRRFGVKVYYGDASRTDLLHAAGVGKADLVIIAVGGADRILDIARNVRRHFPDVAIAARAVDREHAHALMDLGITLFERETFHSALHLGRRVLEHLGHDEDEAHQLARDFHDRDEELLRRAFALRGDREAYWGAVRQSMTLLDEAMQADTSDKDKTSKATGKVDKSRLPRSG